MPEQGTQTETKQLPAAPAKQRRIRLGKVLATGEATSLAKAAELVGYSSPQAAHVAMKTHDAITAYQQTKRRQANQARELKAKSLELAHKAVDTAEGDDDYLRQIAAADKGMAVGRAWSEMHGDEPATDPKLNAAVKLRDHARYTIATLLLVQRSPHRLQQLLDAARSLYERARKHTDGALLRD